MVNTQVTGFGVCVKRNCHKNSYDDDEGTEKLALLTEPLRGSVDVFLEHHTRDCHVGTIIKTKVKAKACECTRDVAAHGRGHWPRPVRRWLLQSNV